MHKHYHIDIISAMNGVPFINVNRVFCPIQSESPTILFAVCQRDTATTAAAPGENTHRVHVVGWHKVD